MTNSRTVLAVAISLIAVQLVDVAIHVATGQVEPLRILSNGVLCFWALGSHFSKTIARAGLSAIVLYLAVNGLFLAINGLTNPHQDGALRVTLFALVGLSTVLAFWLRKNVRTGWPD